MKDRIHALNTVHEEKGGISDADIESNRAGKISKQQRHLLHIQAIASLVCGLLLAGLGLWALWIMREFALDRAWLAANTSAGIPLLLFGGIPTYR